MKIEQTSTTYKAVDNDTEFIILIDPEDIQVAIGDEENIILNIQVDQLDTMIDILQFAKKQKSNGHFVPKADKNSKLAILSPEVKKVSFKTKKIETIPHDNQKRYNKIKFDYGNRMQFSSGCKALLNLQEGDKILIWTENNRLFLKKDDQGVKLAFYQKYGQIYIHNATYGNLVHNIFNTDKCNLKVEWYSESVYELTLMED